MIVNVYIERENNSAILDMKKGSTINNLLELLKINPVTVIPVKNGEVVTEDEKLDDNDQIKLMSVVSGG